MRYLKFKSSKTSKLKSMVLRIKKKKYAKKCKEIYISKKKNILITGLEAAGKSKELGKIINKKEELFKNKKHLLLNAKDSFSTWYNTNITTKDINKMLEAIEDEEEKEELEKNLKKPHVKEFTLINRAENAIIFIDDIDMLQGKKLEMVKNIIRVAYIVIATAKEETAVNKTIMFLLKKKGVTTVELSTESSYDATNMLFVVFIVAMLISGQYELAMLVMAGRYLTKGMK